MKRLYILTFCTVAASLTLFFFKKRMPTTIPEGEGMVIKKEWLAINKAPITNEKDRRPADQTFLTFPEWFLVFSPEEQAKYFLSTTATSFPYMSHIRQIWESYKVVNDQIKDNFPVNKGYHLMIWVIGSSTTVEYAIKAWYETVVGRITDTRQVDTDEDKFNAKYTQDYVDFIKDKPWYEFDFKSRLHNLWATTSFIGANLPRKWERKYILTSELLVKWGYGKLIGIGTKQVYDEAVPTTAVVTDKSALVYLPRYDKFNTAISSLAKNGVGLKEIAGNNSAILLTILVPDKWNNKFDNAQVLFTQPISSNATMKRIALVTPVLSLPSLLKQLDIPDIVVEHIFDY